LQTLFIGQNGRVFTCSGKSLLVFESNSTVAWIIPLDYLCSVDITPVGDQRGQVTSVVSLGMIQQYMLYLDSILKALLSRGKLALCLVKRPNNGQVRVKLTCNILNHFVLKNISQSIR